jgi:hypothetical protein
MQFSGADMNGAMCPQKPSRFGFSRGWLAGLAVFALAWPLSAAPTATNTVPDPSDPIINLFLQKGFITEAEAAKAKAEMEAIRANAPQETMPHEQASRWKLNDGIKKAQFYGDLRLRFEDRRAEDPAGGSIELQRFRYSVRLGVQGDLFDDFYYGLRLETSANPRSSWVTFGSSSSGTPYQGPFGRSTATIAFGQVYAGWRPWDWLDLTIGKMPNPLYTTPMVWDPDINPEGAAERFKYTVGAADVFANFGQFLYQDVNPSSASGGLGFNGLTGQNADNIFQLAFQAGFNYHITTNISFKAAPTLYKYIGLHRSSVTSPGVNSPFFGDPYIGEGVYLGPGTGTTLGYSGYGTSSTLPGYGSLGFPLNQVGIANLLVVDVPFELDFKIRHLDARVFGDASYNLEGGDRAKAAAAGYANWLSSQATPPTISGFSPQKNEDKAWQLGLSVGSEGGWTGKSRHPWEFKTYWQHTEQYALDPNLIDSDVFEGRENMEGVNVQMAYGFTKNVIGSVRYAHGDRINKKLGTGGANQDIPQMNPIAHYDLLQLDLTLKY